jgi:hypothetical protein
VGNDGYDGEGDDDDDSDGNDNADSDGNNDELEPEPASESGDDELFPLDSEDRKLFEWCARSNDDDTSFESVESVGYHTVDSGDSCNDGSDDDATDEFSNEEDR